MDAQSNEVASNQLLYLITGTCTTCIYPHCNLQGYEWVKLISVYSYSKKLGPFFGRIFVNKSTNPEAYFTKHLSVLDLLVKSPAKDLN